MTDRITEFSELTEGEWYHYDHSEPCQHEPDEITFQLENLDSDQITMNYADEFEREMSVNELKERLEKPGIVKGKA